MSIGMKSSVEKLYKASSVADADKALTDAVPTGKFIDEIREATACVQETSHTHQDVIDLMYLEEYYNSMGSHDGLVNGLKREQEGYRSARINQILQKSSFYKVVKEETPKPQKKTVGIPLPKVKPIYLEVNPTSKLLSEIADIPSFKAIESARNLPNSKELEKIRAKDRKDYYERKRREQRGQELADEAEQERVS